MLGVATHVVHVPGPDEGHVSRDDEGEERVEALGGPVVEPRAAVRHRHAYQAAAAHPVTSISQANGNGSFETY